MAVSSTASPVPPSHREPWSRGCTTACNCLPSPALHCWIERSSPMEKISYRTLLADGLWHNNVVFTQLLALCPLMAVTTTATNGLGMGLATTLVLICTNAIISALRHTVSPEVRNPL